MNILNKHRELLGFSIAVLAVLFASIGTGTYGGIMGASIIGGIGYFILGMILFFNPKKD